MRTETSAVASSAGTGVNGSASTNTKGSWTELIASTAFTSQALLIMWRSGGDGNLIFDIGFGSAGNEVVAIANVPYTRHLPRWGWQSTFIRNVPTGTRISARLASTAGSNSTNIVIIPIGGLADFNECNISETWGAVTGSSQGTSVDPGGTANTKGSYTQLIAATAFDTKWGILLIGNNNNTADSTANMTADFAVGAAASEVIKMADIYFQSNLDIDTKSWMPTLIPLEVPRGSRVAMRMQADINDATDRKADFCWVVFG